jgi:predicted P-loop ATPase
MTAATLAVMPEWFCDSVGDLRNKDSAIQLCGRWIIELAELNSIRGSVQVEAVKAYLSRTHDVFRPPYGRRAVTVPRQCVFLGTTNERQYLRDRTGNRRFWPVRCTSIDLEALERDRDQLWAEAVHAYLAGEKWWLPPELEALAADEQDDRLLTTEIDEMVADYLGRLPDDKTEISTREIFVYALGLDPDKPHYAAESKRLSRDVAQALEAAGWHRVGTRGRAATKRTVYRLTMTHHRTQYPLHARADVVTERPTMRVSHGESLCRECNDAGCDDCGRHHPVDGTAA